MSIESRNFRHSSSRWFDPFGAALLGPPDGDQHTLFNGLRTRTKRALLSVTAAITGEGSGIAGALSEEWGDPHKHQTKRHMWETWRRWGNIQEGREGGRASRSVRGSCVLHRRLYPGRGGLRICKCLCHLEKRLAVGQIRQHMADMSLIPSTFHLTYTHPHTCIADVSAIRPERESFFETTPFRWLFPKGNFCSPTSRTTLFQSCIRACQGTAADRF